MSITVNKEILINSDICHSFAAEVRELLEALIDAELAKGDEASCDFIDECIEAINEAENGNGFAAVLPVISRRDFMGKVTGERSGAVIKIIAALCASAAVVIAANAYTESTSGNSIAVAVSSKLAELIGREGEGDVISSSAGEKAVTAIHAQFGENFKDEYTVGESFSPAGISIYASLSGGGERLLSPGEYTIIPGDAFGREQGEEKIKVKYEGLECFFTVRVLADENTSLLTSIYAVFPSGYDFTAKEGESLLPGGAKVFAVYSDGKEAELEAQDYKVSFEKIGADRTNVIIEYKECMCSFIVRIKTAAEGD